MLVFIYKAGGLHRRVRAGIQLCGNVVIPSLFVFMTVASFLLNSGVLGLTGHF